MAKTVGTTFMECTKGANKFYNVGVIKDAQGHFVVRAAWGRIGTKGQYQDKGTYAADYRARRHRDQLISQKKSKGYKVTKTSGTVGKSPVKTAKTKDEKPTAKELSLNRFADLEF